MRWGLRRQGRGTIGTALVMSILVFASSSSAQTTSPLDIKTFTASPEIAAALAKAKAERKGDAPVVVEPILSLPPYRVNLEYRPGTSPAMVHEKDAEMMYVLDGAGTIVTRGTLVDEKRTNEANRSGSTISGGQPQAISKGDLIIIPENTPHQVTPGPGGPITIMSVHMPRPTNWP